MWVSTLFDDCHNNHVMDSQVDCKHPFFPYICHFFFFLFFFFFHALNNVSCQLPFLSYFKLLHLGLSWLWVFWNSWCSSTRHNHNWLSIYILYYMLFTGFMPSNCCRFTCILHRFQFCCQSYDTWVTWHHTYYMAMSTFIDDV